MSIKHKCQLVVIGILSILLMSLFLYVDELKGNTYGKKYNCIITEIELRKVTHIRPGKEIS